MHERDFADAATLGSLLAPPPRLSLADQVAIILRRYVVEEGFANGAKFPAERRLADTLNVSRTVLREALSRLIGEGVLVRQSPRLLVVADIQRAGSMSGGEDVQAQRALFQERAEMRMFIEIGAIVAITERVTPAQLREIERWVIEGERRVARGEPIHLADAEFHMALLRAAGNRMVDLFVPMIEEQIRWLLLFDPQQISGDPGGILLRVIREHRAIYEAVAAGESEMAMRIMAEHLGHYRSDRMSSHLAQTDNSGKRSAINR